MVKRTREERLAWERERKRKKKTRKLEKHLVSTSINTLVDKLIAGEPLTDPELAIQSRMTKLIPNLVRYKKATAIVGGSTSLADRQRKPPVQPVKAPTVREKYGPYTSFYQSAVWRRIRYEVIVASKGRCEACGASSASGAVLMVDHIIPISKAPHLKADKSNLQVLCLECNHGKGAWDQTDWRDREPEPDPRYGEMKLVANNGRSARWHASNTERNER